ncbi:MAG: PqqD family protein [Bacteriovoracaceae bacterium]|jgi:hypothetical protein|nr:PqqD family protein [Bacteriovoracaceae bacterium]
MTSYANSDMVIKTVDDIVTRKNDNGSIILMKMNDSDNFFKIDGIASMIWRESVDNGRQLGEIFKLVIDGYEVEASTLEKDIDKLLQDLRSHKLIVE